MYTVSKIRAIRRRFTIAEINAGAVLLPGIKTASFRLVDCTAIAVGGAATAVTTVDLLGTQGGASVKLCAFAQASLTQGAVLGPGLAGTTVLANGASFAPCDEGTAITVGKTGSNVATATHIDVVLNYAIDQ